MNNEGITEMLECVGFEPVLTKREMFAMAAMQGLLSSRESEVVKHFYADIDDMIASAAVKHADAVLAELARVPT